MPPKTSANSELSEIKQLLLSLTSDLQAVKSDLAELKKNQSQCQSQKSTSSTCASCAARSAGTASSNPEKAPTLVSMGSATTGLSLGSGMHSLRNIETTLAAKVRGTQTATLLLSKEESETDDDEELDDDLSSWGSGGMREDETPLDLAVFDAVNGVADVLHEPGINVEWIIMAIHSLYSKWNSGIGEISHWEDFQHRAKTDFRYCLYGVFYRGHKDPQVAAGTCFCRHTFIPGWPQTFVNKAVKCIRVKRCGDGKLAFHWGDHIGHRPDPGRWES